MTEYPKVSPGTALGSAIAKKISGHVKDRNTFFVFPTQVSADSWAEASLGLPGIGAIETDRFLGWDTFIDRITQKNIPQAKKKADSRSRLLWALLILEEQSKAPFLRGLIKPGMSSALSTASIFAKQAPTLRDLSYELRRLPPGHLIDENETADFAALSEKYSRFLEENGVYEPSHLSPAREEKNHYILFEPALMPGYEKRAEILKRFLSVENFSESASEIALFKFATFREELQAVLANCASLLDEGLPPADIAISIPASTPEIRAHIRLLAKQYALPMDFREGQPLAAYPFGKLLLSLSRAASEGFSLRTLRKLFDRGAFIWKSESVALDLIRFASRYNIPEFSIDGRYMSELWKKTLSLCQDPGGQVISLYSSLNKTARSMTSARSFNALRRAIHDFMDNFLEKPPSNSEADRTLQRVLEELDALDQWHSHIGNPNLAACPLDTLLLALDATRYKIDESVNAISVFPYHIGMLIAAPVHFVMDVSQDSLEPALGYFSRVPKEMRGQLIETDASEALLSSFNAVNAVYCHAEKGLSGYSVPHPYFLRKGARQVKIGQDRIPELSDAAESRAWRDSAAGELPARLPADRKNAAMGYFSAIRTGGQRAPSPAKGGRKLDSARLLKLPSCNAAPLFKISPAKLKNLMQCPFKWFLTCVPDVDKGPSAVANVTEGSLTHALIRSLLQDIALRDGGFSAARKDEYEEWIESAFRQALRQIMRQNGPAVEPAMEAALPKIRDRIARILDFETGFKADGWEIGDFEIPLARKFEELGLSLEGRADRISGKQESHDQATPRREVCAIIDYKKNSTPKKREFLVNQNGELGDFQIASYAAILEGEGKPVELALYWSIEESKAVVVFGPGGGRPSRGEFDPEREALSMALRKASGIIRDGSFLSITPSSAGCAACPMRPICRAHFSSERL